MRVGFGLKAHSGWAALVALGERSDDVEVIDRRRLELAGADDAWARQPYHAAEHLAADAARELVRRGVESARGHAVREVRAAVKRAVEHGHEVAACGVIVGAPMPEWSVAEILAVHFRMHKAEGVLFRDALAGAAGDCGLRLVSIPEKELHDRAARTLAASSSVLDKRMTALGRTVGPPWGKDQKEAVLAAMIALQGVRP